MVSDTTRYTAFRYGASEREGMASMSEVIEFRTRDGGVVAVEATEVGPTPGAPTTRGIDGAVERAGRFAAVAFEDAVDQIRPAAESIVALVDRLTSSPDEIAVEFGIAFHGELGALITKAGADANIAVTLTWRRGEAGPPT